MTRPKKSSIPSDAELAILGVLWKQNQASAKEIHEILNAERTNARVVTTTAKLLQIMLEKELVIRDDSHRPHQYKARVSRWTIQRDVVKKTVANVFDKSASQFVHAALEAETPDAAEIEEIRKMLADYEERQKKS